METFKTPKGTELPFLNMRGKKYLQVAHRLVWFREERPDWSIETEVVRVDEGACLFKCTVKNELGRVIATGHKQETKKDFADFIEKAETGSIGRALAECGYGTQFAPELDEEHRIVDSPLAGKSSQPIVNAAMISEKQVDLLRRVASESGYKNPGHILKEEFGIVGTTNITRDQFQPILERFQRPAGDFDKFDERAPVQLS